MMPTRRRIVVKPLSPAFILQHKERKSANEDNADVPIQLPTPVLTSPNTEKKRILIQDTVAPVMPTIKHNRVLLPVNLITDDSDSDDDSMINEVTPKELQKSYKKLYYSIILFLIWVVVQYWMIVVAGFGAVFFIISALFAIYFNTTKSNKKLNILSAYSVFNPQCKPIHGSADPKQLERELVFGGL